MAGDEAEKGPSSHVNSGLGPLMALGRDPQVLMTKVHGRISARSMQSRSASEKIHTACRVEDTLGNG